MNREPLTTGEYYHVFNHGVDERIIFPEEADSGRFLKCMKAFNSTKPIGSLRDLEEAGFSSLPEENLVDVVCFCLNPNHFHMILKQLVDGGVAEFMKRLGGGYTWFYNVRNKRKGSLFRGTYKSKHISDNDYLLHVSAYVNLNNRVHQIPSGLTAVRSSWEEYMGEREGICKKEMILGQFGSAKEYEEFALSSLELSLEKKKEDKELAGMLLEDF